MSRRWVQVGGAGEQEEGAEAIGALHCPAQGVRICVGGGIILFFIVIVEWWAVEQR